MKEEKRESRNLLIQLGEFARGMCNNKELLKILEEGEKVLKKANEYLSRLTEEKDIAEFRALISTIALKFDMLTD